MLSDLYDENLAFLRNNIKTLIKLSNALLAKESMGKAEIDRFFQLNPIQMSSESKEMTNKDAI